MPWSLSADCIQLLRKILPLRHGKVFICGLGLQGVGSGQEAWVYVVLVEGVLFCLVKRYEGETSALVQIKEARQHARVEGADMHEQDVGNVMPVELLRETTLETDIVVGGAQVAALQPGDGLVVFFL